MDTPVFYGPIPLPAFKAALRLAPRFLDEVPNCGPLSLGHFRAIFEAGNPAPTLLRWNATSMPLAPGVVDLLISEGYNSYLLKNPFVADRDFAKVFALFVESHHFVPCALPMTASRALKALRSKAFRQKVRAGNDHRILDVLSKILSALNEVELEDKTVRLLLSMLSPMSCSFLLQKSIPFNLKVKAAFGADLYNRLLWLSSDEGLKVSLRLMEALLSAPSALEPVYVRSMYDDRLKSQSIDAAAYLFWRRPELIDVALNSENFLLLEGACRVALTAEQQDLMAEKWSGVFENYLSNSEYTSSAYSLLRQLNQEGSTHTPGPLVQLEISGWSPQVEKTIDGLTFLKPCSEIPSRGSAEPFRYARFGLEGYSHESIYVQVRPSFEDASKEDLTHLYEISPYLALSLLGKKGLPRKISRLRHRAISRNLLFSKLLERDGFNFKASKTRAHRAPIWMPWKENISEPSLPLRMSELDLNEKLAFADHGFARFRRSRFSLRQWETLFAFLPTFEGTLSELLTVVKELS